MQAQSQPNGVSINGIYPLNDTGEVRATAQKKAVLSFEIFPAKTPQAQQNLLSELQLLSAYNPEFVSVTYGAGGSAYDGTIETAKAVQDTLPAEVMAHITCAGQERADVIATLEKFKDNGFRQILALRGDKAEGRADKAEGVPAPLSDPFADTVDFIKHLAQTGWKTIRTTAYPDVHKEAKSADADFDWLLAKFDAGATEAITQFFFDGESFLRLRDRLDKFGLADKLIPGILAFNDAQKTFNFAKHCGVNIPPDLEKELDKTTRTDLSEAHAMSVLLDLWLRLSKEGVARYHIYTLNKARPTLTLLELLGVPKQQGNQISF